MISINLPCVDLILLQQLLDFPSDFNVLLSALAQELLTRDTDAANWPNVGIQLPLAENRMI
jgi:hypothetical protein